MVVLGVILGVGQNGKKPSAMDMASMMANTELRNAIMAFTSSMTRLDVSMAVSPSVPFPFHRPTLYDISLERPVSVEMTLISS